ncbi:outer membrane protein OmpA-like peptidoglycan-associated protein [Streptomonospora nanhaiensis]|uniref:Outer membrane protein OmpA-like peptidoglycan-associated protein n=2 Tax=Streptomonospora nanhaiensis TaxID=1323731 RepID=A0A853BTK4_9ACTN|nr:outer membrane protein OmpA-like peptidoglycan-associated protein [Streptomonospora nanhaiensis]
MTHRSNRRRPLSALVRPSAAALAAVLAATACSEAPPGSGPESGSESAGGESGAPHQAAGSVEYYDTLYADDDRPRPQDAVLGYHYSPEEPSVRVDLLAADRHEGHLVVQVRLSRDPADGDHAVHPFGMLQNEFGVGSSRRYPRGRASGVAVLDVQNRALQLPYRIPSEQAHDVDCLCSNNDELDSFLDPGEEMTFYTVHPAPAGTDTATVFTDAAPPFVDVPVTDRAPSAPEGQTLRMPEDVPAAEPDTLAWGTAVEAADASQAVRTDAESTSIDLSADVLFATNESEPSAEAEEVLARTAEQIDASGAAEVTVAGHTDDTGNDAINDPLSRERAENVTSALEDLVAGDVTFTAEGFGSDEPLYDNDTEEGRRLNRRVTISFTGQAQAPPGGSAGPSPTAAPSPGASEASGEARPAREFEQEYNLLGSTGGDMGTARLRLLDLRRLDGGAALLLYEFTGVDSASTIDFLDTAPLNEDGGTWTSGVALTDPATGLRHRPLRLEQEGADRPDLLSTRIVNPLHNREAGESAVLFTVVPLPESAPAATVEAGEFPPFEDVAVAD